MRHPWSELLGEQTLYFALAHGAVYFGQIEATPQPVAATAEDLLEMLSRFELRSQPSYRRVRATRFTQLDAGGEQHQIAGLCGSHHLYETKAQRVHSETGGPLAGHGKEATPGWSRCLLEWARFEPAFPIRVGWEERRSASEEPLPHRELYGSLFQWLESLHTDRTSLAELADMLFGWHVARDPFYRVTAPARTDTQDFWV